MRSGHGWTAGIHALVICDPSMALPHCKSLWPASGRQDGNEALRASLRGTRPVHMKVSLNQNRTPRR
jgi:hypothetical protein